MKHDRLVKELVKLGLKVQHTKWNAQSFFCIGPIEKVEWFKQSDEAVCVNIMRKNEKFDSNTDYFPGFFADTYKEVKKYLSKGMEGVKI